MLNCRRATRLISDRLDRPLSLTERLHVGVHCVLCPPCHNFRRATRCLHDTLASLPDDVQLPAEARDRIRRALEQATGPNENGTQPLKG